MAEELRRLPIHRALNRPDLMAGCERELFLSAGMITAILVFVAMNWLAAVVGIVIFPLMVMALRAIAKADPVMSKIYLRHIKYRPYYAAHSTPFAPGATHSRGR